MHSNIMRQIMQAVFGWIMNFPFPWDNNTFTIFDYFVVCCIIYVMAFFVFKILLFGIHLGSVGIDYLSEDHETLEDFGITSFSEYYQERFPDDSDLLT